MPASWRTFTHAARHCSSVPYCCSNSASVSPCMIARIASISCPSESILHRFRGGRKGGDWLISGIREGELVAAPVRSDVVDFHQPAGTDDEQHLGPQQLARALASRRRRDQP